MTSSEKYKIALRVWTILVGNGTPILAAEQALVIDGGRLNDARDVHCAGQYYIREYVRGLLLQQVFKSHKHLVLHTF